MRWEIFNTETQRHKDSEHKTKWIEALMIWFYARVLKLYPAAFQAAFGDEMKTVFMMSLRESNGQIGLMLTLWREVRHLPLSLIVIRRQEYNQLSAVTQRRFQTRWFVRIIGGLLSLFLLSTLRVIVSPSYNLYAQAVPFVVALFTASISMLIGLRWGRVGGLLTIASGAAIGCCMTLYMVVMAFAEIGIGFSVLIGLIWALPFLIFGILFYELSKQTKYLVTAVK